MKTRDKIIYTAIIIIGVHDLISILNELPILINQVINV